VEPIVRATVVRMSSSFPAGASFIQSPMTT
jgi:hypothetical protein